MTLIGLHGQKNTRGLPKGPAHGGGGDSSYWNVVSREEKRAHRKRVAARRGRSVAQRRGIRR
jgi:hypothetical protein